MRPFFFALSHIRRKINDISHMKTKPMHDYASRQHRSDLRGLLLLVVLLVVAVTVSLCAGDQWIGPENWLSEQGQLFVWQIRLPRTVAVILVGAALALCGTMMQALFENPLAEPGLLGVSNGARRWAYRRRDVRRGCAVRLERQRLCYRWGIADHGDFASLCQTEFVDQPIITGRCGARDYL